MTDEMLPQAVEQAIDDGVDPEFLSDHLADVSDYIAEMTDETSSQNMVYAQKPVLDRAAELLRELYSEQDEYGEREAKMMAVATILDTEADNDVL